MTKIIEYSSKSHALWKSDIDFTWRGDALYWNPTAIRTIDKLSAKCKKKISDVAILRDTKADPDFSDNYNLIELNDIENTSGLVKYRRVTGGSIKSKKVVIQRGDVLFGRLRFYLKNIGISPVDGIGSTEIYPLKVIDDSISKETLFAYLRSRVVSNILILRSQGSNHPRIASEDLKNLPFPELPEDICRNITENVKRANELWMEAEKEFLETEKIFAAIIGQNDYQYPNIYIKYKSEIDPIDRIDSEFWKGMNPFFKDSVPLKNVLEKAFTGRTPTWHEYSNHEGVRILKIRHLSNDGLSWSLRDRDYVNLKFYQANEDIKVRLDDILVASAAHQKAYIGKDISIVDSIPSEIGVAIPSAKLNLLRTNRSKINPYVLLCLMQTKMFYNEIQRVVRGETAELYPVDLLELPVPKKLLQINLPDGIQIEKTLISSYEKKNKAQKIIKDAINVMDKELSWACVAH